MADETVRKIRFVYTLADPRDGAVRYVGASTNPYARAHEAPKHAKGPKGVWLRELRALDLKPQLAIVEEVAPDDDWEEREKHWISAIPGLLNVATGGNGAPGFERSPETREKLRRQWDAVSPEERSQRSAERNRKAWADPVSRARRVESMSAGHQRRAPEQRAAQAAHGGRALNEKYPGAASRRVKDWWASLSAEQRAAEVARRVATRAAKRAKPPESAV
jgi:hypothetical protein